MNQCNCLFLLMSLSCCCSCGVLERSSSHGLDDGFYQWRSGNAASKRAYLAVKDDQIAAYEVLEGEVAEAPSLVIPLEASDSLCLYPHKFSKQGLDVDITSNLFKFRRGTNGRASQLSTDFNAAIYAGWRHDTYYISSRQSPLNQCNYGVSGRGFDFGIFAGPATTPVGSFSTDGQVGDEYNGFVVQYGVAAFLESSFASFGLSVGFDHLLSKDRLVWIYNDKPWVGFIVGIALN